MIKGKFLTQRCLKKDKGLKGAIPDNTVVENDKRLKKGVEMLGDGAAQHLYNLQKVPVILESLLSGIAFGNNQSPIGTKSL